jgi:hypothetical protein
VFVVADAKLDVTGPAPGGFAAGEGAIRLLVSLMYGVLRRLLASSAAKAMQAPAESASLCDHVARTVVANSLRLPVRVSFQKG